MLGRLMQELCETRYVDSYAPSREPLPDLLHQPAVAVGIAEGEECSVATTIRIRTRDPEPPKQVGLIRAGVYAAGIVEDLTCRDAARE